MAIRQTLQISFIYSGEFQRQFFFDHGWSYDEKHCLWKTFWINDMHIFLKKDINLKELNLILKTFLAIEGPSCQREQVQ